MIAAVELKLLAAALILLAGIGGSLFAFRYSALVSSLTNTFAGGVFLGAALMHMLPDAVDKFGAFAQDFEYPLFALVAAGGFLLVLLLDKILVPGGPSATSEMGTRGSIFPYVLMLTLSAHSVITGIALGLEDHLLSAVALFVAVMAHKSTAAMALAISFTREAIDTRRSRSLVGLFCLMTPVGIILGTWVVPSARRSGRSSDGRSIRRPCRRHLFLHRRGRYNERGVLGPARALGPLFLTTVLGFAVMAVVAIWT